LGLGLGALQGLSTGQGLGAALGGALAGGVAGGISPKTARAQQFNMLQRPKILERWQLEDMDAARARQTADGALNDRYKNAQISGMEANAARDRAEAEKALLPQPVQRQNTPGGLWDPSLNGGQGGIVPGTQPRQSSAQKKLGRNVRTGQIDYYDPATESADFEPYQFPRENRTTPRQPQRAPVGQINKIKELKRRATNAWDAWGKQTDPEKRRKAQSAASAAQGAYNDAVAALGESFPDAYEVGGFTEQNGNQGWGYYKPRQGGQAQGAQGQRPTANPRFVDFIMQRKGFKTPEEARQWIESQGYAIE
jgi:hypothetical protein